MAVWPPTVASGFPPDSSDWNAIVNALQVWGDSGGVNPSSGVNANGRNLANINVLGCVECDVTTAAADTQAIYISAPILVGAGVQVGPRLRISCNSYDTSNHVREFVIRPTTTANAGTGRLDILTALDGGALSALVSLLSSGNVGVGTTAPTVALDVNGAAALREATLSTFVNGANQNVTIPAFSPIWILAGALTGAFNIGGFSGGHSGQILILYNGTAFTLTLNHQDAGSSIGNRLWMGAGSNISIASNRGAVLVYLVTGGSWVVVSQF